MNKIIEITNCKECPRHHYELSTAYKAGYHECKKTGKVLTDRAGIEVPKWCPLEDKK